MRLDLRNYFAGRGDTLTAQADLSDVALGGARPFQEPVQAKIRIDGGQGYAQWEAQVSYTLSMPCDRCCEETTRTYERVFRHRLVRELAGEEDGDEVPADEDGCLDPEELIREDVSLDLPAKFLCREDCKGLCPRCGKNLNLGPCGCGREIDPRLEALRALLGKES